MDKSKWIEEIYFGTLSGGMKNGIVSFEIRFGGEPPINGTEELAKVIELLANHPGRKHGKVHLCGKFSESEWEERLSRSLADMKFEQIVTVEDQTWRSWFAHYVNMISVALHSTQWGPFKFSELIYDVFDLNQAEPILPGTFNRLTDILFVRPAGKMLAPDLFKYISKSDRLWNIYTETKRLKEILYRNEETK